MTTICNSNRDAESINRTWITARVDAAVARRFKAIESRLRQRYDASEREGGYLYGCYRTEPQNLGFRLRQSTLKAGLQATPPADWPKRIAAGEFDDRIEAAWHDAASAAWYYRYEKQYD
jgi:hypothetical protein